MAGFDYSIISARRGAFQPARKGLGFGNFESVKALPNVGEASTTTEKLKRTGSHFNNKKIFHKVCHWFETWMPWQKRILLCGTTDRCSNGQLEYLATALEPAFHRDFSTALHKERYPGTPLKAGQKEDPQIALLKALQMATKGTEYEDDYLLVRSTRQPRRYNDLEDFALEYVREVIEGAFEIMYGRSSDHSDQLNMQSQSSGQDETVPPITTLRVPKLRTTPEEEYLTSESTSRLMPTVTPDSDNPASRMTPSGLHQTWTRNQSIGPRGTPRIITAPASQSSDSQPISSARSRWERKSPADLLKHGRYWTFPGCQNMQTPLFSDNSGGQVATNSGTNFTPGYGTGSWVILQ